MVSCRFVIIGISILFHIGFMINHLSVLETSIYELQKRVSLLEYVAQTHNTVIDNLNTETDSLLNRINSLWSAHNTLKRNMYI